MSFAVFGSVGAGWRSWVDVGEMGSWWRCNLLAGRRCGSRALDFLGEIFGFVFVVLVLGLGLGGVTVCCGWWRGFGDCWVALVAMGNGVGGY